MYQFYHYIQYYFSGSTNMSGINNLGGLGGCHRLSGAADLECSHDDLGGCRFMRSTGRGGGKRYERSWHSQIMLGG